MPKGEEPGLKMVVYVQQSTSPATGAAANLAAAERPAIVNDRRPRNTHFTAAAADQDFTADNATTVDNLRATTVGSMYVSYLHTPHYFFCLYN